MHLELSDADRCDRVSSAVREEAYATLVRLQGGRLLAVARRFFPAREDARDAVQEAFLFSRRASS